MQSNHSAVFTIVVTTIALLAAAVAPQVAAQGFPERQIRLIVPLAPGGGNDGAARVIAAELSKRFGQQVIVDNRPGGGSIIASQVVLSQPADGYTLYLFSTNVSMAPLLHAKMPFDTLRDFSPMSRIGISPGGLIVHPSLPVHRVTDLVALAKAKPEQIAFGSSGPGGGSHLGGELFNLLAKVKLLHVPYKGSAMATTSVLSGETQVAFNNPTSSMPHIKAGRLRLVAVTTAKRWPLIPDVPTIAESGVKGYEHLIWNGLAVRSGTPKPVFDRLYSELIEALKLPQLSQLLARDSSLPSPESPQAFMDFLESEQRKWAPVVKQAGISAL
ncbi:MAG: tripartite tricarboxylate transporter substrate binding protein [Burkholderiales bacterium]|nr:tripartite tricarboxylate transporter substrate binding protein [Burkholderiales bacterium]